jgi:hypothetical protein
MLVGNSGMPVGNSGMLPLLDMKDYVAVVEKAVVSDTA